MDNNIKFKRIILEFHPDFVKEMDKLKDAVGVKTRTALMREALSLLACIVKYHKQNYSIQFQKDDEIINVIMPGLDMLEKQEEGHTL